MNSHRKRFAYGLAAISLILALVGLIGCTSVPQTTSTGTVHEIVIDRGNSPGELTVNIGDDIRWVNQRLLWVRIDLIGDVVDAMACEHGVSNIVTGTMTNWATLYSNRTANVCFAKTGLVSYSVQMDTALPARNTIVTGTIRIVRSIAKQKRP